MSIAEGLHQTSAPEDQVPVIFEEISDQPLGKDRHSRAVSFAWLELTGVCQEECDHCYAESSPKGTHGTMTTEDWMRSIDQLAEGGTSMVQFIGGEPTLYPDLIPLMNHALGKGVEVEVYSNLVHVTDEHWTAFSQPGVRLATSYYSKDPSVHKEITNANTHNPIRKNIRHATEAGIPLRVGIIGVQEDQDISGAKEDLISLGVEPDRIKIDFMRQVGRGVRDEITPETTSQLCGNCANGVVAILPDGSVQPCVFSRQPDFRTGNIQEESLQEIFAGTQFTAVRGLLRRVFTSRHQGGTDITNCSPDCNPYCNPTQGTCTPDCPPSKDPCVPDASGPCDPYDCPPLDTCRPDSCRP